MSPSLAVIMPIYNGAKTLARSLDSLADADLARLEIIAVVQQSDDGSRALVAEAARRLPITLVDTEADSNWVRNTNIGLRTAQAEIATMLHQDDLWLPGRHAQIDRQVATCPETSLWAHPALYIDENDRVLGRIGPPFGRDARLVPAADALTALIVQNSIPLPGAAFRRAEALAEGGLREDLWYTADWDLWLRLTARAGIGWSPEPGAAFRLHEGSQTVRGSARAKDFAGQLAAPLARADLPLDRQLARMARASAALNALLAGRYHGQTSPLAPFLHQVLPLGPLGWIRFLRRSQIAARLWPRVRLFLGPKRQTSLGQGAKR